MQTGRLFTGGIEHPHAGCVLGYVKGPRGEMPAHVLIAAARSVAPEATCRTATPRAIWAGNTIRSSSTPIPQCPISRCPICCRPRTSHAVRADRRQRMRDAVDAATANLREQRPGPPAR